MSFDPWSAIAQIIIGGATKNMKDSGSGASTAERGGYNLANRQQGIKYQGAPNMGNSATSPSQQLTTVATSVMGTPVSNDQQRQAPILGDIIKAEEAQLRNVTPAQGGYVQMPTAVNSNVNPFQRQFDSGSPWAKTYKQYGYNL